MAIAGLTAASRPVFAADAPPAPAPPAIAAFPVKGDPQKSLQTLERIVSKSWGSGKVLEKSDTGFKAQLVTPERVKTAAIKEGELLKVGAQVVEHKWTDIAEFKLYGNNIEVS